ncbi:hypothetical protein HGRIS_002842 [Hohenbuehelia grisea]|uniref:Uncharacterized protein n=1 Tax=Hohenbuehelia grisea TaxID=104357 RepID=A0ABR3JLN3_9AGAR
MGVWSSTHTQPTKNPYPRHGYGLQVYPAHPVYPYAQQYQYAPAVPLAPYPVPPPPAPQAYAPPAQQYAPPRVPNNYLQSQAVPPGAPLTGSNAIMGRQRGPCNFCSGIGHLIGTCPIKEQYFRDGKIQIDPMGCATLPGSGWIHNSYPGNN